MSTEFSLEIIELLFEAVKIMIPVVTGFTVLFGGSLGRLWERKNFPSNITVRKEDNRAIYFKLPRWNI